VNDLVNKKRYRPDFKKILQNPELSNEQKLAELSDDFKSIFEEIEQIFLLIDIGIDDREELISKLEKIVKRNKNNVDLFFDAMKPITDRRNKNILTFLKAVKYIAQENEEYNELASELENSIRTGMQYNLEKAKKSGGEARVKAEELANFYAK
jgi:signal recognition particle GTPase